VVLPLSFHSLRADFAPVISRKFERGRFLVISAHPEKLGQPFGKTSGNPAIRERSFGVLQGVPGYNPNLSREGADFSLGK
jgi:hypothetical protein